jgi:hypothetical protein
MGMGQIGHIGFSRETSWGTAVIATKYLEAMSESLALTIDRFEIKNVSGLYTAADDMSGLRRIAGNIVFPVFPEVVGHFLRGVFGNPTVSVVLSGNLHTNIFKTPTADFAAGVPAAPYTFEVYRDVTSSHQYAGSVISGLSMSVQPNQDLRATASIIAKSTSVISKTTPTFVSSPVEPFNFAQASLSLGGSATAVIEALTVNMDQQLEGVAALNASTVIAKIRRRGPQMIGVSGTVDFDNLTEYTNFVNQTEQALSVNFRSNSFNLLIELPRVIYTAFPAQIGGKERLTVNFDGAARYHTGSATAIAFTLTTTSSGF